jgi:hypothetical protein
MVHNTDQFLPRTLGLELDSEEIFSFTTIPVSIICYLSILVLLPLLCLLEEPHHKKLYCMECIDADRVELNWLLMRADDVFDFFELGSASSIARSSQYLSYVHKLCVALVA